MRKRRRELTGSSVPTPESRLPEEPPFRFTDVPAEFRERLIEELKSRPEFARVYEAAVHGAGVTLSLTMPEPIEFSYDGWRFHAFAWMGKIHVIGEKDVGAGVRPGDRRGAC